MFKAANDKNRNRENRSDNSSRCILGRQAAQHAQADQNIAEKSQNDSVSCGNGCLGGCQFHRKYGQAAVRIIQLAKLGAAISHQNRPNKVAYVYKDPVF